MIMEVKDTLLKNSIEEAQVYFELFTASKATETVAPTDTSLDEIIIEIIADDATNTVKAKAGNTILDTALNEEN